MSNGHRWGKFWWQDWQNDAQLKLCGHLAKGVWIDLLCLMAQANPVGHLVLDGHIPSVEEIAELIGMPVKRLAEVLGKLEQRRVFSRTPEGVIYSRRMVRDAAVSDAGREHVAKRWNGHSNEPPPNRGANSEPISPPNRVPNRGATRDPNTLEAEARSRKKEPPPTPPTASRQGGTSHPDVVLPTNPRALGTNPRGKPQPTARSRNGFDAILERLEQPKPAAFAVIDGDKADEAGAAFAEFHRRLTHG